MELVFQHQQGKTAQDLEDDIPRDVWRVTGVYICGKARNRRLNAASIVTSGEWECAIGLRNSDTVGGYHGYEVATGTALYLDGRPAQRWEGDAVAKKIEHEQQSTIFHSSTGQPIALRRRRLVITRGRVRLEQTIEWLCAVDLISAWVSMLPIKRTRKIDSTFIFTDRATRLPGGEIENVSEPNFDVRFTRDTENASVWGSESGVYGEMHLHETPRFPNARFYVSNVTSYNKMYWDCCGRYKTSAGETWKVKTVFKVGIKQVAKPTPLPMPPEQSEIKQIVI